MNQKYPLELSTYNNRIPRRVNKVDSMGGGRGGRFQGRGRGHYGGGGRRGHGGRFMVDVDEEVNMSEEAGKTWYINGPDPMPEWYSVTMAHR